MVFRFEFSISQRLRRSSTPFSRFGLSVSGPQGLPARSSASYGCRAGWKLISREIGDDPALGRHPLPVRGDARPVSRRASHPVPAGRSCSTRPRRSWGRPGPPRKLRRPSHGRPRSPVMPSGTRGTPSVIEERQDKRSRGHRPSHGLVDGFPAGMGVVHPREPIRSTK